MMVPRQSVVVTVVLVLCLVHDLSAVPSKFSNRIKRKAKECNCECGVSNRRMRVVGGNVTRVHEFPWIAGLSIGGEFYCGASLITRRHVLTAAHCVYGFDRKSISIVLGDHDRKSADRFSSIVVKDIRHIREHEAYNPFTYNNDIAILELNEPVTYGDTIRPACLPDSGLNDYSGKLAVVTGWGRTSEEGSSSIILRKAVVPVWSKEECYSAGYSEKKLSENMFCAGEPSGKQDACQGDSGGPLHLSNKEGNLAVIGLVSWGRGCGRPNYPGVYTKVQNYLDWIEESLHGECLCAPS